MKGNLGRKPPSVEFRIDDAGRFSWGSTRDITAARLLGAAKYGGTLQKTKSFLQEVLADGPKPSKEVDELAEARGISLRTLNTARDRLGVTAEKIGRTWRLRLP
jgi:hypothetical protein